MNYTSSKTKNRLTQLRARRPLRNNYIKQTVYVLAGRTAIVFTTAEQQKNNNDDNDKPASATTTTKSHRYSSFQHNWFTLYFMFFEEFLLRGWILK
jgi:pectin methylesterase-like acyl-CoA thioesterase